MQGTIKKRAKDLNELVEAAKFLVIPRPLALDPKAVKVLDADARALLSRLTPKLAETKPWGGESVEAAVRSFAESEGRKLGEVAQPLRAALTGRTVSPGIFEVLEVLGSDESLGRLADLA